MSWKQLYRKFPPRLEMNYWSREKKKTKTRVRYVIPYNKNNPPIHSIYKKIYTS